MPMSPLVKSVRHSPSLLLLASLIILLLASPNTETSVFKQVLVNVLFAVVMLAAVPAVSGRLWQRPAVVSLAALWVALSVWKIASSHGLLALSANAVFLMFCLLTVIVLIRRIVTAEHVDFEVLCASPSIFLLLAIAWTACYDMLQQLAPGSFNVTQESGTGLTIEFLYFSLTTITTLGYGDITPVSSTARIWATLEAVVGQFYMAVLVARLVGLYRR